MGKSIQKSFCPKGMITFAKRRRCKKQRKDFYDKIAFKEIRYDDEKEEYYEILITNKMLKKRLNKRVEKSTGKLLSFLKIFFEKKYDEKKKERLMSNIYHRWGKTSDLIKKRENFFKKK